MLDFVANFSLPLLIKQALGSRGEGRGVCVISPLTPFLIKFSVNVLFILEKPFNYAFLENIRSVMPWVELTINGL